MGPFIQAGQKLQAKGFLVLFSLLMKAQEHPFQPLLNHRTWF
jgi:hypothetical protein